MISRTTVFVDRVATVLLGLVLLALGIALVWWWAGTSPFPDTLSVTGARTLVAHDWWPWASGAVGVLLVLLGLRWLAAHVAGPAVHTLGLEGSGSRGRLDVAAGKLAAAAADAFADTLGVRSAKGRFVKDRGQLVARIRASVEPDADLGRVAAQADLVSAQLAQALDRDDVRCRVELTVASWGSRLPRVS